MMIKKNLFVFVGFLVMLILLLMIYFIWLQPTDSRTLTHSIGIARKTKAGQVKMVKLEKIPKRIAKNTGEYDLDIRYKNLSDLDLTDHLSEISHSSYSSLTRWPQSLPKGFDPEKGLELGKNPGLHVRDLHKSSITGKGVSIGIIDQTLYTQHSEYKDQLKHYEELHILSKEPEMHGAAVSSLAVGKNIGVAPESHLYYIASSLSDNLIKMARSRFLNDKFDVKSLSYKYYAQAIDRFLELNKTLPENEKIRVISMSAIFQKEVHDYDLVKKAIDKAKSQNIFVVSATLDQDYGIGIAGLGKEVMADPDDEKSYSVGNTMKKDADKYKDCLFLPMDSRTYAGTTGENDYEIDASSGVSWTVPYLAGLYALSYQVNDAITPEKFLQIAKETSDSQVVDNNGQPFRINYLVTPEKLIEKVKEIN